MPYDDSPVQDAPSGFSYKGNSLVANAAAPTYSAPGGVSVYSGFTPSGSSSNSLTASASPVALMSGSGGNIQGSGTVNALGGGSSSSGYSGLSGAQQAKLNATAESIGANPSDLYAMLNYQTNRTFDPAKVGGKDDQHLGLLQFGPTEQKKYGVTKDQSFDEQLDAAGQYLKDRGFKPGMGLAPMASIVLGGSLKPNGQPRLNARDQNASIKDHIAQIQQHFYPSAVNDALTKVTSSPNPDQSDPSQAPGSEGALGAAAGAVPMPTPRPYKQGDGYDDPTDNASIANYQKALADRGYYSDTIDGKFGPKTRAAVNAARANAGMNLNGLLDSDLQKRLDTGAAPTEDARGLDPALMNPRLTDAMGGGHATPAEMTAAIDPYTQAALDARQAVVKPHVATKADNVEVRPGQGPGRSPTGNSLATKSVPVGRPAVDADQFAIRSPDDIQAQQPIQQALEAIGNAGSAITPVVSGLPAAGNAPAVAAQEPGTLEEIRQALGITESGEPITGRADAGATLGAQASLAGPPGATLKANIDPAAQPASLEAPLDIRPRAPATIDPDQPPPGSVPAGDRLKPATEAGAKKEGAMERQIQFDNMYRGLKPGDVYTDPEGNTRRKGTNGKGYGKTSDAGKKGVQVASRSGPLGSETPEWKSMIHSDEGRMTIEPTFIPSDEANSNMTNFQASRIMGLSDLPHRFNLPGYRPVDQGNRNDPGMDSGRRTL